MDNEQKNKRRTKMRKIVHPPPSHPGNLPNMEIPNENPLLDPFILEMVLIFCKGHHQKDNTFFPTLRLVCKMWDIEVCKIYRQITQMPLARILSPYPEGLGWKWNGNYKSIRYHYQSPYPDSPEFVNIKLSVTDSKVIKDPKVRRWFKVMGGQVKSLEYSSALNCYHQNVFLGNLLQSWCPNLEQLHLSGVQCFTSLIYIFEGLQVNDRKFEKDGLNCKNLKTLLISVDSDNTVQYCVPYANRIFLTKCYLHDLMDVLTAVQELATLISNLPEKDPKSLDHPLYQLIEKKIDNLPINYFKDAPIPKYFYPDGGVHVQYRLIDWGVLGLILRVAPLEKIVIKKLRGQQQCRELALFLLYHPSKLRSTLKHLEFHDNVFLGKDPFCLKTLSLLKCPLTDLRVDNLVLPTNSTNYFTDMLIGSVSTLTTLVVGSTDLGPDAVVTPTFKLPELPNLVNFSNRNISRLPMEGDSLLRNCPKLKVCKVLDEGINHFGRDYSRSVMDLFCDDLEECADLGHGLKELKICGGLDSGNVEQLAKGLKNLRKVDLEVGR